jgi:hypothetical protein
MSLSHCGGGDVAQDRHGWILGLCTGEGGGSSVAETRLIDLAVVDA